ncbi:MAG: hypothetical protein IPN76_20400 [Saprospiraceae bacterium]|nr:hypothetical protein [Saprospiraceae bacterium]
MPGSKNKYTLFHLKLDYHPVFILARTTLYMTMIDMSLNDGLGEVIEINRELLTNGRFGSVNAIKHANGRDWWIYVAHEVRKQL